MQKLSATAPSPLGASPHSNGQLPMLTPAARQVQLVEQAAKDEGRSPPPPPAMLRPTAVMHRRLRAMADRPIPEQLRLTNVLLEQ